MLKVYLELGKFKEVGLEASEVLPLIRNWPKSEAMTEWLEKRGFNLNNPIDIKEDLSRGLVHFKQALEKRKKTVLLVDDDSDLREILRFSFETRGYIVFESESVREAIARLRRLDSPETFLDLAIIDYQLHGPNGLKFVDFLKRNYADTKAVILTGNFPGSASIVPILNKGSSNVAEESDAIMNYDPAMIRKMKREIDTKYNDVLQDVPKDGSGQSVEFKKLAQQKEA